MEEQVEYTIDVKLSWWGRLKRWWEILWHEEYELIVWYVYETAFNDKGHKAVARTRKNYFVKKFTKVSNKHIKGYDLEGMPFEIKTVEPFDFEIRKRK